MPQLFGTEQLSERGVSHLCDNVILLEYVPHNGQFGRAMTVLKTRASSHRLSRHAYQIDADGIVLADGGEMHQDPGPRMPAGRP